MHRSPAYGKIKSHSSALNKQEHFFQDFSVNMKSICYICISQCAVMSHYSTRKSLKTPCQLVIWFGCIYYRLDQMCAGSNRVVQIKHFFASLWTLCSLPQRRVTYLPMDTVLLSESDAYFYLKVTGGEAVTVLSSTCSCRTRMDTVCGPIQTSNQKTKTYWATADCVYFKRAHNPATRSAPDRIASDCTSDSSSFTWPNVNTFPHVNLRIYCIF